VMLLEHVEHDLLQGRHAHEQSGDQSRHALSVHVVWGLWKDI
jgi:hypothetical protein